MKRRSIVFLSLVLSIVLCVPSLPALADNPIILYCTESIDGFFEGTYGNLSNDRQYYADRIFPFSNSFEYNNYTYSNLYNDLPSSFFNGSSVILSTRAGSNLADILDAIRAYDFTGSSDIILVEGVILYQGSYYHQLYAYSLQPFDFTVYNYSSSGFDSGTTYTSSYINTAGYTGEYYAVLQGNANQSQLYNSFYGFMYVGDELGVYCYDEASVNYSTNLPYYVAGSVLSNQNSEGYTNFHPDNLPYWNGNNIVVPDQEVIESNSNHMYFNSCQLGFCEPYGVSNFSSFGGAYFYARYSVDEWVRNHITDYSLYFYATAYVDSRQYSGSTEVRLDNDGCITIPFSDIFTTDGGVVSDGFLAYISPNLVEQSFYDTSLYSVNKEQIQNFVDQRNLSSQDDWDRFWEDLYAVNNGQPVGNPGLGAISYLSSNFSGLLNGTISPSIINLINNHTNFKIHVNCYLKDNSGNVSGTVGKMFDLKVGNNFSTNNEGLTNNDPFIETDLPSDYVPSIISDNNGYSLSDIGNSNQIVNFQFPSDIELFIDNGFKHFLSWYETSADTAYATNRFWSSMGIFEGNPASELYSEYFGFLPDDFKSLIFSCAGIGIVGGAFCILRRRLH